MGTSHAAPAGYTIEEPSPAVWEDASEADDTGLHELYPNLLDESSPQRRILSSAARDVVRIAVGETGVCETPVNRGVPFHRYVRPWSPRPEPWCAFFVSWAYAQAAGVRKPPWSYPGAVRSVHDWAAANGKLRSTPGPGRMFGIYNQHMGLIRGTNPQRRTFLTIEGNTSSGCVKSNNRPWKTSGIWYADLP